jgi:spermidine/putrescine-binding protein
MDRLKQEIKLGNISASQAEAQLKLQQDKFKFDKEQQLTETERAEYNNYIDMVDSSSFVYQNANGETVIKEGSEKKLRNYIIGLFPDDEEGKYDNLVDTLLLRYGLPVNENEK